MERSVIRDRRILRPDPGCCSCATHVALRQDWQRESRFRFWTGNVAAEPADRSDGRRLRMSVVQRAVLDTSSNRSAGRTSGRPARRSHWRPWRGTRRHRRQCPGGRQPRHATSRSGSTICRSRRRPWSRPITTSPTPSQAVQSTASAAVGQIAESRHAVETAVSHIAELVAAVARIESRLAAVGSALTQVAKVSGSIEAIAKQTNLLALNATIEAARAGDRRPRLCRRRQRGEEPRGGDPPGDAVRFPIRCAISTARSAA